MIIFKILSKGVLYLFPLSKSTVWINFRIFTFIYYISIECNSEWNLEPFSFWTQWTGHHTWGSPFSSPTSPIFPLSYSKTLWEDGCQSFVPITITFSLKIYHFICNWNNHISIWFSLKLHFTKVFCISTKINAFIVFPL